MHRLYKRRKAIYNFGRMTVSFIGSYIILAYGEPEGFFEIFSEPGFRFQLAVNTLGFFALSVFIGWIMAWKRPMISKLKYGTKSWLLLFLKGILIPSLVVIGLSYAYFVLFRTPFNFYNYLKVIFPISLLMILVFSGFELAFFGVYYSTVLARNATLQKYRRNELNFNGNLSDDTDLFGRFYLIELDDRRVMGTDSEGEKHRLSYTALKEVKKLLLHDDRFFSTGGWIVQFRGIESYEKDQTSRTLRLYLKEPCKGYLKINKNDRKRFLTWYELAQKAHMQHIRVVG